MELYFLICIIGCLMILVTMQLIFTPNQRVCLSGDIDFSQLDHLMFFAASGEEKTEKPSQKKLQDTRKKGQVIKSADVSNFIMILTAFVMALMFGPKILENIKELTRYFFINSYDVSVLSTSLNTVFMIIMNFLTEVAVLVFVPLLVAGIAVNLMQTGFLFTSTPLKPQFSKLNPINGFKEMFSRRRFMSMLKNILLLIICGVLVSSFMSSHQETLMMLSYMRPEESLSTLGEIVSELMIQILTLVFVIAAVDYGIQRFEFLRGLRMTKQEVKEEYKQMEGDPFIKGKRRQKQREMAARNISQAVSESSVVVVNPTHYAVAIRYVHEEEMVPMVMAKGLDYKALKIKELAKEHDIPIIENKPLARSLYGTVDEGQEIPVEMYKAIAELLAVVYKLEKSKHYY